MNSKGLIFLLILVKTLLCENLDNLFQNINEKTEKFNSKAAEIAWESSINPGNINLPKESAKYQKTRIGWHHKICNDLSAIHSLGLLNDTERRQVYLLCRGPKFTYNEARLSSNIYEELQSIYSNAIVCIPIASNSSLGYLSKIEDAISKFMSSDKQFLNLEQDNSVISNPPKFKQRICLNGEKDFENMMKFSRNENVLRWLWLTWREKVGPSMKEPYRKLVDIENQASMRNGYPNIGATWRDELEMPRLRRTCRNLYNSIQPLYKLLHAVVRFYLRWFYGDVVSRTGPIPAHLLGNLWSLNWEPLADLMLPRNIDLDQSMKKLNWTVLHMVKRAEDFYQSMGLPAMTDTFWRESIFTKGNKSDIRCHGTAADMFKDSDYRLLYCSEVSMEDFYVLHHELGHIQYYMAYKNQPTIFRQANAVLHETIGDTIMYGVLTPQHLNRLRLINDSLLYVTYNENKDKKVESSTTSFENEVIIVEDVETAVTENDKNDKEDENIEQEIPKIFDADELTTDMILIFKQALNKLPHIPFALVIDQYRWKYFEGGIEKDNEEFWNLVEELQGVAPPGVRGEEYFDVGAKFHVPDNTPYIRYFLSSFLQHQLFEKLCKAAVFGRLDLDNPIPESILLSRCDIYGSKAAGKVLKNIMFRGHSQHWTEILLETIGEEEISASALNRYYRPLYEVLEKFVLKHDIPVGW